MRWGRMSEKKKGERALRVDDVAGRNLLQVKVPIKGVVIFLAAIGEAVTARRELVIAEPAIVLKSSLVRKHGLVLGEKRYYKIQFISSKSN